jgi:tetratricopeptide (TPR) repeat protein
MIDCRFSHLKPWSKIPLWMLFLLIVWHFLSSTAAADDTINFRVIMVKERREAQEILEQIQKGEPFWKLAMERSLLPNALLGGYVEGAQTLELREEFVANLDRLSPGDVSPVFSSQGGFAVLKREGKGPSRDAWNKAEELHRQAVAIAARGEFSSAGQKAQEVLSIYPTHQAARCTMRIAQEVDQKLLEPALATQIFESMTMVQQGSWDKALGILEGAARSAPDIPETRIALGEIFLAQGQTEKAIASYEKALSSSAWTSLANIYLGAVFLQQGDASKAISHYQAVIAEDIGNPEAHLGLGLAYLATGASADAVAQFRIAIAIDPHMDGAYDQMGLLLLSQSQVENAVFAFEKALSIRPDHVSYLTHLGIAYHHWGMYSKAVAILERALALAPDDPLIHNNLAIAYFDNGEMDKAVVHADRAKSLGYQVHANFLTKLESYRKETAKKSK